MQDPSAGLVFTKLQLTDDGMDLTPTPKPFATAGLTSMTTSFGGVGKGLPFHNHASAWQAVVVGAKRYAVLPQVPTETNLLNLAPLLLRNLSSSLALLSQLDNVPLSTCVLHPGDAIYIPCNTLHATQNLLPTLAIGGQASDDSTNYCPEDSFGRASATFREAMMLKDTGRRAEAKMLLAGLCQSQPFHLQCIAELCGLSDDATITPCLSAAEAMQQRLLLWHSQDHISSATASAALTYLSQHLAQGSRAGASVSKSCLEDALMLDPTGANLIAWAFGAIKGLAEAHGKPNLLQLATKQAYRALEKLQAADASSSLCYMGDSGFSEHILNKLTSQLTAVLHSIRKSEL